MALAPYFDKAALAAATLLQGYDRAAFEETLDQHVIGIAFDHCAADTHEGRVCVEQCANLIARFYPRVAIVPLGAGIPADFVVAVRNTIQAINPFIEFEAPTDTTVCITIGTTAASGDARQIFAGSDAWAANLSASRPLGCGGSSNPFGAAAAACIAAGNLFRLVFKDQIGESIIDEISFSTATLRRAEISDFSVSLDGLHIDDLHLVGVGAIGNGVIWSLARAPGLRGHVTVIDGEQVDATNAQRYVLLTPGDIDEWKVDIALREFHNSKIQVHKHRMTWGQYVTRYGRKDLRDVLVALDSAKDRIAVQASMPSIVRNSWTQVGELGVSRHESRDDSACLACLYIPLGKTKNEDQLVADAIGLPHELRIVRDLLYTAKEVGTEFLQRIAAALGIEHSALTRFADQPLRRFYSEALCGGLVMRLQAGRSKVTTEVPMAFQSALAGVLLAATAVAECAGANVPIGCKTILNLLRPLPEEFQVPISKHPSGNCICQDGDFRAVALRHSNTEYSDGDVRVA